MLKNKNVISTIVSRLKAGRIVKTRSPLNAVYYFAYCSKTNQLYFNYTNSIKNSHQLKHRDFIAISKQEKAYPYKYNTLEKYFSGIFVEEILTF
jgi:hypothetical protein